MSESRQILVLGSLAPEGIALLEEADFEVCDESTDPIGILVRSRDLHAHTFGPSLQAVARAGAGVNNIPVGRLSTAGIPVFFAPGANAGAVAELVVAGLFLAARNLPEALHFTEALRGSDESLHEKTESEKRRFAGYELRGRTLGVIGLGAIGVRVVNAASALGMRVLGFDPGLSVENALRLGRSLERCSSVEELLRRSDAVTVHVPLLPSTRGLLDAERFARLRSGTVLLNFARAEIVDTQALLGALEDGRVARYVSDFPITALQEHPRATTLPHLGASTAEAQRNCAVQAASTLLGYLRHGEIRDSVNFPEMEPAPGSAGDRLVLAHDNVPGMLERISHSVAERSLNIAEMSNRARGELACTLLDLESSSPEGMDAALAGIPGMRRVRRLRATDRRR